MHIEEFLYSRFAGTAGITALVATRISPTVGLAGASLPYMVYTRVGGEVEYSQDGPEAMEAQLWQFDAWGASADSVVAVGRAIVAALHVDDVAAGFYAFVQRQWASYELESKRYRYVIEARILYRVE